MRMFRAGKLALRTGARLVSVSVLLTGLSARGWSQAAGAPPVSPAIESAAPAQTDGKIGRAHV